MSRIIINDQLSRSRVLEPISRLGKSQRLRDLRPGEIIKDERVPSLLRNLRQPTFITIDAGFWNRNLRDPRYCILYFPLPMEEQHRLPDILRRCLRLPQFRTRAARMGTVARVSTERILLWRPNTDDLHTVEWPASRIR